MNKRIKYKKKIFKKRCNEECLNYKLILGFRLITNNCCNGCRLKQNSDRLIKLNEEYIRNK